MKTNTTSGSSSKNLLIILLDDSLLINIRRNLFHNSFKNTKCYIKSFSGPKTKGMERYRSPSLTEQKTDIDVIHIGGNYINYKNLENGDVNELARSVANFGKKYSKYGV